MHVLWIQGNWTLQVIDEKQKILVISDHALYSSGVAVQTKSLIMGLLKTQKYEFIQLGAAVKHKEYGTITVSEDFHIKPIDGFGNKNLLRSILINERPSAIIIFSDPRFFEWLFEMEDEIHQVCPILWWHVWDNCPTPRFNDWMYESVDIINCHSYLTYRMCSENFPGKTNFIPHSFSKTQFFRLDNNTKEKEKERILGKERKDNFVCLWINRNCYRKRPGDVLYSWSLFLKKLSKEKKKKVTLLMHTNPEDNSGQNLIEIAKSLNILDTIAFSVDILEEKFINIIHNISDVCLNMSYNEGFGLSTLESMMVGNPIIATKTGGLYRQVVDFRDNTENGVALEPEVKSLSGTQTVPYIFKDFVSCEKVASAIFKLYNLTPLQYKAISKKVEEYSSVAFSYESTIKMWDISLSKTINDFKRKQSKAKVVYIKWKKFY